MFWFIAAADKTKKLQQNFGLIVWWMKCVEEKEAVYFILPDLNTET